MNNSLLPTSRRTSQPVKPRRGAWFLAKLRKWHGWLGVAMALLIVVVCLSGLYLNHKDLFGGLLRSRRAEMRTVQLASLLGGPLSADAGTLPPAGPRAPGRHTTATPPAALQACMQQALQEAKNKWGDVPLEKVEFKFERGSLFCQVTSSGKEQLAVDAESGAVSSREDKKKPKQAQLRGKQSKTMEPGKLIKELHTGKLGGLAGKFLVDFTSLGILALTLSGLYLWAWPKIRRHKTALSD